MDEIEALMENNRKWAASIIEEDPRAFIDSSMMQKPKYLWIGCSDSRIPAEKILGLRPGEMFVHRNIANICPHTDFNVLSVIEYGVNYLGVDHIIICGHYRCGGVTAAMETAQFGLVDNWLRHIRDVYFAEKEEIMKIVDKQKRIDMLAERNAIYQALNVCHTTIVQGAWSRGKSLTVHAWIFDVYTGLVKKLGFDVSGLDQIDQVYRTLHIKESPTN